MMYVTLFLLLFFGMALLGMFYVINQAMLAELRVLNESLRRLYNLVEAALLGIKPSPEALPSDDDAITYVDELAQLRQEMRRKQGIVSPVGQETE